MFLNGLTFSGTLHYVLTTVSDYPVHQASADGGRT